MAWYDYVPGVSNVAGVVKGDPKQALLGPGAKLIDGITPKVPIPEDLSKGPDAEKLRGFADTLQNEYTNRKPGTEKTVAVNPIGAASLDQSRANEAREVARRNLAGLEGVASGATPTAADALLQRGTDRARQNAAGLAAAYSRSNPGLALRAGLNAGNQAQAEANAVAAQQKAQEQAQARGQIGQFADAMRGADLGAATFDANATNDIRKFNTTADINSQKANQDANLTQQNLNNQFEINKGQLALNAVKSPFEIAMEAQKRKMEAEAANAQSQGSMYSAIGGGLMKLSDERAKTEIKPASLADALGETVHGVSFRYKPGLEDGGKHVGVLAQDVEKVIPGVVTKGRDGLRRVNTGHLTLAHTGVIAELAKRLKVVESRT